LLVARQGVAQTSQLVWTDGGLPTREQRRALEQLVAGCKVPTAVVSPVIRVRGTVAALSWFNARVQAFPPTSLREAIAFLEVPASRVELIECELGKLRLELEDGLGTS
jgi:hypothetical protein